MILNNCHVYVYTQKERWINADKYRLLKTYHSRLIHQNEQRTYQSLGWHLLTCWMPLYEPNVDGEYPNVYSILSHPMLVHDVVNQWINDNGERPQSDAWWLGQIATEKSSFLYHKPWCFPASCDVVITAMKLQGWDPSFVRWSCANDG